VRIRLVVVVDVVVIHNVVLMQLMKQNSIQLSLSEFIDDKSASDAISCVCMCAVTVCDVTFEISNDVTRFCISQGELHNESKVCC
jgi:hypothetical protein